MSHGFDLDDKQIGDLLFNHTAFPFTDDQDFLAGQLEEFFKPLSENPSLSFDQLQGISTTRIEAEIFEALAKHREESDHPEPA